ncbi:hypothetical protein SAMN05428971_0890 [Candidatus Pantoea varia]|uniref:Uncharacterized protein n=2 Tax=Candidatus Pantoea varia TaxID=1881036 RepID=A0A1I4XU73_9GAMM|nr:hypothetical protein SAMN05428971_0890 [Pantoea varia]
MDAQHRCGQIMHKTYPGQALTLLNPLLSRIATIADPRIEVMSGYPANCSAWLTVYYQRKSGKWSYEWYDRVGYRRPTALGSTGECLMREVSDRGASRQEHSMARRVIAESGFFEA